MYFFWFVLLLSRQTLYDHKLLQVTAKICIFDLKANCHFKSKTKFLTGSVHFVVFFHAQAKCLC